MNILGVCVCVCQTLFLRALAHFNSHARGPGRVHRRLVSEAGDVPEDMEVGRHYHIPAF